METDQLDLLHTVFNIKTDDDTDVEEDEYETMENLNATDENTIKRKRTCWVSPMVQNRKTEGEFAILFETLEQDKEKFKKYFNMSYEKFNELVTLVTPYIEKKNTSFRAAISPKERLAVCLRYLVTGDTFKSIAVNYRLGASTVHQIINLTCQGIWKSLVPIVMPQTTLDRWNEIENGFSTKWNFPNCLGVLSGRQIVVHTPKSTEKTFSIMLLALIDHNSKFIIVDVGDLYKISEDGNMFTNSLLGKLLLTSETFKIPEDKPLPDTKTPVPHVFIADHSIPLKKNIMRIYGKSKSDNEQKLVFNEKIKHVQKTVENTFRMLLYNYQVFQRKINLKPDNVENVLLATCCLHNFLIDERESIPDDFIKTGTTLTMNNLPSVRGNATNDALSIRDKFKNYFTVIQNSDDQIT